MTSEGHAARSRGDRVRCLTLVDEYTRECLASVVAPRLTAEHVVRSWTLAVGRYGAPQHLRTDHVYHGSQASMITALPRPHEGALDRRVVGWATESLSIPTVFQPARVPCSS